MQGWIKGVNLTKKSLWDMRITPVEIVGLSVVVRYPPSLLLV